MPFFQSSPRLVLKLWSSREAFKTSRRLCEVARLEPSVCVVALVAAGISAFSDELGELADGVVGPSQWEAGVRR